jgi:hypothetical protein
MRSCAISKTELPLSGQLPGGLAGMEINPQSDGWIYIKEQNPPPEFHCIYVGLSNVAFGTGDESIALGFHIPCADCFETPASGAAGA